MFTSDDNHTTQERPHDITNTRNTRDADAGLAPPATTDAERPSVVAAATIAEDTIAEDTVAGKHGRPESASPSTWVDKELSWLSFNHRVLQEALDESNPAIERARFIGIYSNNLDEFYRVRVGGVRRRILLNQEIGGDPEALPLLEQMQAETVRLNAAFDDAYQRVVAALAAHNVHIRQVDELDDEQRSWLTSYFDTNLRPYVCPLLVTPAVNLAQVLADDATYLTVELTLDGTVSYALIEVPTEFHSRFIELPAADRTAGAELIYLDDAIRLALPDLLDGYIEFDNIEAWAMKFTRDAEYDLTDELDESLLDRLSTVLKERLKAEPTRLSHDRMMPQRVLSMLNRRLGIRSIDIVVGGGRYHNMKDLIAFPSVGPASLRYGSLEPLTPKNVVGAKNYFDAIRTKDVLLYYPYHDFRVFTEWLRQAAMDPDVSAIRISLYRVASSSLVIKALLDAAANGKEVTVVLELTARFDEEANIAWSKVLTDAGVKVSLGIASLKTHSKLCLITRLENGERVRYAHVGTGNFNEKTGTIYTDFSVLTARTEITDEVLDVFGFIEAPYRVPRFEHLWVSPLNQRDRILALIEREIDHARAGRPARFIAKINNLADEPIVERIYAAARAGVTVDMIVRGMCVLVTDQADVRDNLRVISVVDRFLEHPRAMVFFNDGEPEVYLSSADWMARNLDNRVEVAAPVLDSDHRNTIIELLDLQLRDNTKARIVDGSGENHYVPREGNPAVRSQLKVHDYLRDQI